MKYDVIVCGGGIQGFWTANHLVERKQNVLLLEQFPFPHSRGSSQGPSRITRYSYTTEHHARMMLDAFKLWKMLEDFFGSQIFVNCGLLSLLNDKERELTKNSLDNIKCEYEVLSPADVEKRFNGMSSLGYPGIYERTGGVLKSQKCLEALHKRFLDLGGKFLDTTKVQKIVPVDDQHVDIVTSNGSFSAKTLVLTCGPWTNKILKPLHLQLSLLVRRISVEYWQAKRPELYEIRNNFPATIVHIGTFCYSTPILEYPGLMKFLRLVSEKRSSPGSMPPAVVGDVGVYGSASICLKPFQVCIHGGVEVDPDETDRYNRKQLENFRRDLRSVVAINYPNLIPHAAVTEKCLYTVTPDGDFILDFHPRYKNIIIGAGFSGHGFKLSPVIGEILADLATGVKPKHEMKFFSITRFNKSVL